MRVLALVTDAFGGYGGIAQYNRDLIGALAAEASIAEVAVLVRTGEAPGDVPRKVRQLPPIASRSAYAARALQLGLSRRFDLVFCGHLYHGPLAALVAGLARAKLICQGHGIEVAERPSRARRRAFEQADLVLCVSRDTRARVLDWADIAPERVAVLPNTVGEQFAPGQARSFLESHGLKDRRVLLSVARLDSRQRHKGQDRVIAALPALVARGLDVVYLIAGEGDDRQRLEQAARDLGVSDRVMFLGRIAAEALRELYCAADLFVLPSSGEGFGIAFVEAMACGTPALGLDAGGAADALGDSRLGFALAPAGDLAAAIVEQLCAPKARGKRLSATTRERFERAKFTTHLAELLAA